MLIYYVGAFGSSVLGLLTCALLVRKFWNVGGIWRHLMIYSMIGVGFDCQEWRMALVGRHNVYLRQIHDVVLQGMALAIMFMLLRRMGRGRVGLGLLAGPFLIALMVLDSEHGAMLFRSVNGTFTLLAALVTLSLLFLWQEMRHVCLHRAAEFWMLTGFVVCYASQAAMTTWVYRILHQGGAHLGWLEFPVSYLPDTLTAIYLALTTVTDRHV